MKLRSNDSKAIAERQIWDRYQRDQPRIGIDYEEWCGNVATELGLEVSKVKNTIAREHQTFNTILRRQSQTVAQEVAQMVGADMVAALDVLREGLVAESRKPLLDKSGRPIFDEETGQAKWWSAPDWPSRLSSAKALIEVHGGNAPKQLEVKSEEHLFVHLSEPELATRLMEVYADLGKLTAGTKAISAPDAPKAARGGDGAGGGEVPARINGLPLLSDGMHQDQR